MRLFNRLGCVIIAASMLVGAAGELSARTKKGDKLLKEGRKLQVQELWDEALELFEQALAEDPADPAYQMAVRGTRFQAGQSHVKKGKDLRKLGKFAEALAEFQRAYTIDPGSEIAEQELRRTYRILKELEDAGKEGKEGEDGSAFLPEAEKALREAQARMDSMLPVPILKPISRNLNTLKMNNQPVKVLFETVGKLAGINVVFDPEFQSTGSNLSVDLTNTTLEEALQYLSVQTKT
jgi:general secretion pathway protein D